MTADITAQDATPVEQRRSTVALRTGVELHYVEQGLPDAAETLLLLHGWPDSWFTYSRVLPALDSDRHRAVAVDQRGFGRSQRPARGYTIDDLATDAIALLDTVGVDAATIVGHSLGSFVARRIAEIDSRRVRRLVLIGTAVSPRCDALHEVADVIRELPDDIPEDFVREFQAGTLHRPVPDAFFDGIVTESRTAPGWVWRAALAGLLAFDDTAGLGDITVPTLVLGGERDELFPVPAQRAAAAAIPSARLRLYPNAGHCPNWEVPADVAADIDAFLRET